MADSKQFESLTMQYMDQLYSTARYWTGSESDAADLVQETYLRAFKGFDKFEIGTNSRAWLFKIMKNTHLNMIRKEKTSPKTENIKEENIEESEVLSISKHSLENGSDFLQTLQSEQVENAIKSLPQEQREAILLVELEGFTYKEASGILNVPTGTLMSRLSRARKKLAEVLYEYATQSKLISK